MWFFKLYRSYYIYSINYVFMDRINYFLMGSNSKLKNMKRKFVLILIFFLFSVPLIYGNAEGDYEILSLSDSVAPINDTTLSLSHLNTNYGSEEELIIGKASDGICLVAMQFNLNSIPLNSTSLLLILPYSRSEQMTYHALTIYGLVNLTWDELNVTGLNNDFNIYPKYVQSDGNYVQRLVSPNSTSIEIDLLSFLGNTSLTLIFTLGYQSPSYLTVQSKESQSDLIPMLEYMYPTLIEPIEESFFNPTTITLLFFGGGILLLTVLNIRKSMQKRETKT